jgi:hypothetical protein
MRQPRLEAAVGLGTWIRSFSINDPIDKAPKYEGAAFTIGFSLLTRPAGFFTDGFASNIFLRFAFKQAVGLQSRSKQLEGGTSVEKILGTTLREINLDWGYNWRLGSKPLSPFLDLGMGYGMMDFGIDWEGASAQDMPSAAYRYRRFGATLRLPFVSWLGAHAGADYRLVFGAGEVEDETKWYGPASTGGINFVIGANGNYKGFTATAEYAYTRYFYAFKDPEQRQKDGKTRIAGGALDILHTLLVNIGYSF